MRIMDKIDELREVMRHWNHNNSQNAKKVIDALYNEPIINRKKLMEITNIRPSTIKDTVNILLENNIIVETTGYSRNQVFAFQKYIDLFLK